LGTHFYMIYGGIWFKEGGQDSKKTKKEKKVEKGE
jgi:hypothetical protein